MEALNSKLRRLAGLTLLCGVLGGVVAARPATAETRPRPAHEFWISSARLAAGGDGTREHPFDGSTREQFDAVMRTLPPNVTLHLLPGTYSTLGCGDRLLNWRLKAGQRILGSGRDVTMVRLAREAEPHNYVICSEPVGATNIEVADLTVDCGYTSDRKNAFLNGVTLYGSHNAVRRVNVINGANRDPDPRYCNAYGIVIGTYTNHNSEGVIVENCRVSRFAPLSSNAQGVSGIALLADRPAWISGILRSNVVDFSETGDPVGNGLGGAWMRNSVIEGNVVRGAVAGVYGEVGENRDVTITHNLFENCEVGIFMTRNPRQNLTIHNNTFSYTKPFFSAAVLRFDDESVYTNIVFMGNTVTHHGLTPGASSMFLAVHNIKGLVVAQNRVDAPLGNVISHCTGVQLLNNLDARGMPLVGLGPADPKSIGQIPPAGGSR